MKEVLRQPGITFLTNLKFNFNMNQETYFNIHLDRDIFVEQMRHQSLIAFLRFKVYNDECLTTNPFDYKIQSNFNEETEIVYLPSQWIIGKASTKAILVSE